MRLPLQFPVFIRVSQSVVVRGPDNYFVPVFVGSAPLSERVPSGLLGSDRLSVCCDFVFLFAIFAVLFSSPF